MMLVRVFRNWSQPPTPEPSTLPAVEIQGGEDLVAGAGGLASGKQDKNRQDELYGLYPVIAAHSFPYSSTSSKDRIRHFPSSLANRTLYFWVLLESSWVRRFLVSMYQVTQAMALSGSMDSILSTVNTRLV
jgi:hypothetical protein